MKEIESSYKNLIKKINWSKYKNYIMHYGNNLLNVLFVKYEFNKLTKELSPAELKELKQDILSCIKNVEMLLENEILLEYLKINYINENYDIKKVMCSIRSINRYIKKYY